MHELECVYEVVEDRSYQHVRRTDLWLESFYISAIITLTKIGDFFWSCGDIYIHRQLIIG